MRRQRGDIKHLLGDIARAQRRGAAIELIRCRLVAFGTHQGKFGLGNPRRQIGDPHAGAKQIAAQVIAELLHKRLAGAIHMAAGIGPLPGDRADIDNTRPGAMAYQRRQQGVGHRHQTGDVGVDHRFPVLQRHLLRRQRRQRQPGVVDQGGDIGEGGGERRHGGSHRLAVTNVKLNNMHRHLGGESVLQGLQSRIAAPAQHQRPARVGKHLRCRFAKTRGRPGDKHYVARCHLILLCGCPFTIKTPDDKAQGQTTGGDVTPCHIVMRALALSDLRGQGQ